MRFLLDTNMLSDLARHTDGKIAQRLSQVGEAAVCTSIVVASELRFGQAKGVSQRLDTRITGVLRRIQVLPFESPADLVYGRLRAQLERTGQTIGAIDTFIAAHALALGCTMVTANLREFSRIEGLVCENWLA